jgi:plastocyanin
MKTNMRLVQSLASVTVALGLASCGGGGDSSSTETETVTEPEPSATAPSPAAQGGEAERAAKVQIVEFAYSPDPVRVEAGGKVIWQNMDSAPHTATADDGSFDTGPLEEGKLKSETFKEPGTYAYHCEIHPSMHGTVEVVEPQ